MHMMLEDTNQALYDGQYVDAHFTRSFYKHMLGQPLTYER
jgi:E3 ubiquitin-protein ligase HUWE1